MSEKINIPNDEIDLKDLFLAIWKGKYKIIAITLIIAIATCLITMFIIDPVYQTRLDILINIPESIETKYGTYDMLLTSNEQYIELIKSNDILSKTLVDMGYEDNKLTIEALSDKISITKDEKKPNSFIVYVASNTKSDSLNLAKALYKNYIFYIKESTKVRAAEQFYNYFEVQRDISQKNLNKTNAVLDKNIELLSTISQTINSKEAIKDIDTSTLDYVVLENAINENYTKVEADIIEAKQSVINLETNIDFYNGYLQELNVIQEQLVSGNEDISFCKIINTSIKLASNPVEPSRKSSPSTALNVVISAVFGGIISVIYVLIRKYWFDK